MDTSTALGPRVESRPLAGVLVVGDTLALTAFVVAGSVQHGQQPLANPAVVGEALAPFLLAWLAVAVVGGLYTAEAVLDLRRVLAWTVPAWAVAVLLGQGLRATSLFSGGTALAFVLVTLVVGGTLLVGWRVLVAFGLKVAE